MRLLFTQRDSGIKFRLFNWRNCGSYLGSGGLFHWFGLSGLRCLENFRLLGLWLSLLFSYRLYRRLNRGVRLLSCSPHATILAFFVQISGHSIHFLLPLDLCLLLLHFQIPLIHRPELDPKIELMLVNEISDDILHDSDLDIPLLIFHRFENNEASEILLDSNR